MPLPQNLLEGTPAHSDGMLEALDPQVRTIFNQSRDGRADGDTVISTVSPLLSSCFSETIRPFTLAPEQ